MSFIYKLFPPSQLSKNLNCILPKQEKGLVLLIFLIVIILASASYVVSKASIIQIHSKKDKDTMIALKEAKKAVVNYAVTYSDRAVGNGFGVMPHPETVLTGLNEGSMPPNFGTKNTNILGWLPWRTLGLPTLKDSSNTCLLYAVSGTYKVGGSVRADMINEDSLGMFRIVDSATNVLQGINEDDRVVALVFSAGAALPVQARNPLAIPTSCGQDYGNVTAYLEGDGAIDNGTLSIFPDQIEDFIHSTDSSEVANNPYNDKFLTITRDEIWKAIIRRDDFKKKLENLTHGLALCLAKYANQADNVGRRLPWPAMSNLGVAVNYRDDNNYDDIAGVMGGYSGRFPFKVDTSNDAIDSVKLTIDQSINTPGCDNLDIGGGVVIDLMTVNSVYRDLWENWKDHFFYILSKDYEPDNAVAQTCDGAGVCISVNTTKYAGAVIFSGARLDGVTRNDKSVIADYLENDKETNFNNEVINKTGSLDYNYTTPQTELVNDVMYCIEDKVTLTDNLTVIEC